MLFKLLSKESLTLFVILSNHNSEICCKIFSTPKGIKGEIQKFVFTAVFIALERRLNQSSEQYLLSSHLKKNCKKSRNFHDFKSGDLLQFF